VEVKRQSCVRCTTTKLEFPPMEPCCHGPRYKSSGEHRLVSSGEDARSPCAGPNLRAAASASPGASQIKEGVDTRIWQVWEDQVRPA
jgi:hypothetical protein